MTFADLLIMGRDQGPPIFPESAVHIYPWSNAFALQVANSRPGNPILRGKLHPSEFDHKKHKAADLPADPLFAGKTIGQIMAMKERGELDRDKVRVRRHSASAERNAAVSDYITS